MSMVLLPTVAAGEGYEEDLTFEALPQDKLDELRFSDGPTGVPRQVNEEPFLPPC